MIKITIDGKLLEVEDNLTIIQAARINKIDIPHFCWHPKLSVSGNCRICLVEVEKMPKLVIACATKVTEGMVVYTSSEKVIKARNAVMEFILINHPLDCPICDEAGECKLQDYAYKYGFGSSRFEFDKVRKPKRVELGSNVILDAERCIMCSRCIRFYDEIIKRPKLTFIQRGDHVVLATFPGKKIDDPYSMNIIELCPVGALTSRGFRFKARVWELSSTDTVCIGCSRGCNIKMWVRNNEVLRLTPRYNPNVNDYWMCDAGRLNTFKFINAKNRIKTPLIRKDGKLVEVGWDEAIATVVSELKGFKKKEIAALGSPFAANEDNYLLAKMMKLFGVSNIGYMKYVNEDDEDSFLIKIEKSPNSFGAGEVGVAPGDDGLGFEGILTGIKKGSIKALYSIDDAIAANPVLTELLPKLNFFVVHASNENGSTKFADVVLPSTTYAEMHGTFINFNRYIQRIRPAVVTFEYDRSLDDFQMSRLDKFGAQNDKWMNGVKYDARPTWRILTTVAAPLLAVKWKFNTIDDVFREISENIESFKGLTYKKIGSHGCFLRNQSWKLLSQ